MALIRPINRNIFLLVLLTITCVSCSSLQHKRFFNEIARPDKGPLSYIWMRLNSEAESWPEAVELPKQIPIPPSQSESVRIQFISQSESVRIQFINHSTFLIQLDNTNILTDPVFSERASPFSWIGPKRVIEPGLQLAELPPIDIVLISHDHYDHLDADSIKQIVQRYNPEILLGTGVSKHLDEGDIFELNWWQSHTSKGINYTFTPAQHASGRGLFDKMSTLWGGFVIENEKQKIFFAGDTGFGPHFAKISERFSNISLALLPIGAYEPRSFMHYDHMNPQDAVEALTILKAEKAIGMHWGTFQFTNEGRKRPIEFFQAANHPDFIVLNNGECLSLKVQWLPCEV